MAARGTRPPKSADSVRTAAHKAIAYLRHLENREWADAWAMCSEKATVWHNDGKGDSTIQENISSMEAQIDPIQSMRYDITRQFSNPTRSSSNTS